jgi:hypothetical protein
VCTGDEVAEMAIVIVAIAVVTGGLSKMKTVKREKGLEGVIGLVISTARGDTGMRRHALCGAR